MMFSVLPHMRKLLCCAALTILGGCVGFALGTYIAHTDAIGCLESDLTPLPDTSAIAPAASSPDAAASKLPEKWVCLTFDDGPSKNTSAVLKALADANVRATFFVVATGYNDKYLPLIADAASAGHQIALHSATHEYRDIYSSADAFWQDIALLRKRIAPYTDADKIRYLRFPGGSTNTISRRYGGKELMRTLKNEAEEKGMQWVDWNVCAEDAVGGKPSAASIYNNIVRETGEQKQCIVLMHDSATTGNTASALPDIIKWYKAHGYAFCTVEQAMPPESNV